MHFLFFITFQIDEKQVLKNVSGEFHSRELSAIMGELKKFFFPNNLESSYLLLTRRCFFFFDYKQAHLVRENLACLIFFRAIIAVRM